LVAVRQSNCPEHHRQGVTTEVVGNCGESFARFTELARTHLTDRLALYGYDGPRCLRAARLVA
jgi:N-acyl-D-aspartate/D-glutamate deacylase